MVSQNSPLALKISIVLLVSIPLQLLFWTVYHTTQAGGSLNLIQILTLAVLGSVYLILARGLSQRKKWAHMTSVILLGLMSVTAIVKLAKGLSHPSFGYLLFLVTYLVAIICLLVRSTRIEFR